jgi:hypothetical protein
MSLIVRQPLDQTAETTECTTQRREARTENADDLQCEPLLTPLAVRDAWLTFARSTEMPDSLTSIEANRKTTERAQPTNLRIRHISRSHEHKICQKTRVLLSLALSTNSRMQRAETLETVASPRKRAGAGIRIRDATDFHSQPPPRAFNSPGGWLWASQPEPLSSQNPTR